MDTCGQTCIEEITQRIDAICFNGKSGCHCMPSASQQKPLAMRCHYCCAQINPVDGSRRCFAHAVCKRYYSDRLSELLFKSACDDADNARMPSFARHHDDAI